MGCNPGQLSHPSFLTVNNNLVYVSYVSEWADNCVSIFDTNGNYIHCFGKRGSGGEFKEPYCVTVDKFCNLYINDYCNNRSNYCVLKQRLFFFLNKNNVL